ncbi:MAG: hypothetical protein KJ556_21110 [Gammaproteobacteria bacterium]|nr:hypothetical protein [Gammaproteobacteria bacterium]
MIREFHDKGLIWPVSDAEYNAIFDGVANCWMEEMKVSDQTGVDVLIASFGVTRRVASYLQVLLAMQRIPDVDFTDWLEENRPDIRVPAKTGRLRRVAKFLLLNRFTPKNISHALADGLTISLGTFSRLKREFLKREGGIVFHRVAEDFLQWDAPYVLPFSSYSLLNRILALAADLKIEVGIHQGSLCSIVTILIAHICVIYIKTLHSSVSPIRRVLLSEVSKGPNKAVCLALKRRFGTEIIGFEHGNTFGMLRSKYFAIRDLAHCDKYVVATKGSVLNFEANRDASMFPYGLNTRIEAIDSDYYRSLYEQNRR